MGEPTERAIESPSGDSCQRLVNAMSTLPTDVYVHVSTLYYRVDVDMGMFAPKNLRLWDSAERSCQRTFALPSR